MANFTRSAALALVGFLSIGSASASTAAPTVIQNFDGTLLSVMKQAASLGAQGRYEKLLPVVQQTFDIPFMTKIVVGAAWQGWTPQQREAMTTAFGKFLAATYARRFDGYGGESFVIDGSQDNGTKTFVSTHLVRVGDSPVVINYLMRPDAVGSPKIVDVLVTGTISELATRRSEFASILDRGGYDALLAALEAKSNPQA
ncbi:MAG TPA: ABC transporter substrate-binding protein [Stellaceae bacterium]|jgi:phospholipid transport system substrate-binding protein|nr:ABC transporter substrate-binding protein [Stellaceae bacterium]